MTEKGYDIYALNTHAGEGTDKLSTQVKLPAVIFQVHAGGAGEKQWNGPREMSRHRTCAARPTVPEARRPRAK